MYICVNGIHGNTNMTVYTKAGVGGHISVSMDTINTNIHDRLLSWLGVNGHVILVFPWIPLTQIYMTVYCPALV